MLISILSSALNLYTLMIFVWAMFSWFDHSRGVLNDIYKVLDSLVRPYVGIFKRFIPPVGNMDLSPLVALIALQILARILFSIIV